MSITRNQFDILTVLEKSPKLATQREIAQESKRSLGTVNKTMQELIQLGYVSQERITPAGQNALEPYRVKRAVFIAAGFGTRLVPITLNTPKPLVRVNGTRIIDTLLDAVTAAEIEEIYIVRGYLAEQFDQLLYKYPNIRFIENPAYNETNNISSAMCARYLLKNAYVLEADLLLYNPALITKYQYISNYLGVPVDRTDDWCFHTNGRQITKMTLGGTGCHHMFGISYWTEDAGAHMAEDVKKVYEMPGGKERFWDQVALEYCLKNYKVEIRECSFEDIVEIDTFRELKALDKTYGDI
ncbi:NTP transferase domain-containing protein [Christensenellaceae bacterium OttesenSCG-928-K19]|nr:NTP transferase domain-containing protein [Christensenellaceae bacterium OttesenSCG-928-K19]